MIVGLEGKIVKKELTHIHLNVGGVIYQVFVSINCSSNINKENIFIHTTHIIREDSQNLYGFLDINEQKMFDTLIKINGIGAKVALAICSTYTPSTFSKIVETNDITALKRVPGIGPKSAGRIMVELSGFAIDLSTAQKENPVMQEAFLALESLGFKSDIINKVLTQCVSSTTSDVVKEALK
ncbi:MAG: Holliday junction branch migration protein RuvA, partial [Campylobacterales bacterium]|nr:Holliday junction branch migration protein RuvA [Campylobacterales bacterium]